MSFWQYGLCYMLVWLSIVAGPYVWTLPITFHEMCLQVTLKATSDAA